MGLEGRNLVHIVGPLVGGVHTHRKKAPTKKFHYFPQP